MSRITWIVPLALFAIPLAGCVAPPEDLECRADEEGNHLTWAPVENATHYNVYRADADQDLEDAVYLGNTTEPSFTDTDVTPGAAYRYWVSAVAPMPEELDEEVARELEADGLENESLPSEVCEVVAIPFFPSAGAALLAVAGAGAAVVLVARRR